MAQHDYVIANGTGAAVRSDLNNALAAIVSQNSGATAPSPTYAYQFWADTTTGLLKLRNAANSAWITLFQLDGEWSTLPVENGTAAAPSIYFKDSGTDTGFYSPGTDQIGISTGGTARLTIDANGNVAVDTNTLYVDAPNNRVGIGTSSPSVLLDVYGTGSVLGKFVRNNTGGASGGVTIGNNDRTYTLFGDSSIFSLYDNTAAATRLAVDTSGRVGIGTASPGYALTVSDGTRAGFIQPSSGLGSVNFGVATNHAMVLVTNDQERARIDSSGRLLVGTSTSAVSYSDWRFQISGQAALGSYLGATTSAYNFNFIKSRSSSVGTFTIVASGDKIGGISFNGDDGTDYETPAASIEAFVDGTPGANDMPGRLVFSVTADGGSSPTEAMRIRNNGEVNIGSYGTGYLYVQFANGTPTYINRTGNDGDLISFRQDGTAEGSISVSGTTVSYNGAHLSRWSQLPSGAERTEILRGSVLSNIDEMCEWGEEDNEQLNRMKVSDVEGDKNVSGVFQAWDDDDDTYTNDFYCAMTGDFIIRIGSGVTVERGDLLMSAGDGTAKPQVDDLVRSCTVAKVTSTHVTCTYDDGSYCVPCVLMTC